jgi:predicted ribosomally synthesized peptide with SipW-like signal peptide
MKKRNILLSSICSIMLCLSIVVGATFALFTSQTKVNVAVTSGKVEVYAYATNEDLYSTLGEVLPETSIVINDEQEVVIDKIVPGDVFTFDIVVENHSNVTVQYNTVVTLVEGYDLFKGLEVTIGNVVFAGSTAYTNWAELAPIAGNDKTFAVVPVTITLPEDAGNEYQDLTAKLCYTVNAVQGNAPVVDPFVVTYGTESVRFVTFKDAMDFIANAVVTEETDFVLTVAEGLYYDNNIVISQTENKNVTIKAQEGKEVVFKNAQKEVPTFYVDGNGRSTGAETFTLEGITFDLTNTAFGVQLGSGNADRYAHNVTVLNCNFVGDNTGYGVQSSSGSNAYVVTVNGGSVNGLATFVSVYSSNLTVVNVTAENIDGFVNNSSQGSIVVDNCVANVNGPEAGYVVRNQNGSSTVTITNSTLSLTNTLEKSSAVVVARANTTLTMTGNTFTVSGNHAFEVCSTNGLTVTSDMAYNVANAYKKTTYTVTNYDANV